VASHLEMTTKEAAMLYLKQFRGWNIPPPDEGGEYSILRFADRRQEAMRRARMAGLSYREIGEAVGVCGERASVVIKKAIADGQDVNTYFARHRAVTWDDGEVIIRANVKPMSRQEWFP